MPKKLTKKQWTKNYKKRHKKSTIKMTGNYNGGNIKTEFICNKGHKFISTPANVLYGKGCSKCIGKYKYRNTADWNTVFKDRYPENKIRMVGEFTKAYNLTGFRCKLGHKFMSIPSNILKRGTCPMCENHYRYKNADEWNTLFLERYPNSHIKMVGEYCSKSRNTLFVCGEGHKFSAAPSNILHRNSCPQCSFGGIDLSKPTRFYILATRIKEDFIFKVGITNKSIEDRYRYESAFQCGWIVVLDKLYKKGQTARNRELRYKKDRKYLLSNNVNKMPKLFSKTTGEAEVFINHPDLLKKLPKDILLPELTIK